MIASVVGAGYFASKFCCVINIVAAAAVADLFYISSSSEDKLSVWFSAVYCPCPLLLTSAALLSGLARFTSTHLSPMMAPGLLSTGFVLAPSDSAEARGTAPPSLK
ncbi:hypothetical protein TYRP_018186 [Tyrophagus putrescentiae]|nr:hypothetical protein TYRP_018186 [Tyrophagus putrescentiae]